MAARMTSQQQQHEHPLHNPRPESVQEFDVPNIHLELGAALSDVQLQPYSPPQQIDHEHKTRPNMTSHHHAHAIASPMVEQMPKHKDGLLPLEPPDSEP